MRIFNKYMIWQCPTCGRWQGHRNNNYRAGMSELSTFHAINKINLRCINPDCNKQIKFKDKSTWGSRVKHYWFSNPRAATQKIKELKKGKPVEISF